MTSDSHLSLQEAIEAWDSSAIADRLLAGAEQRAGFIERFPHDCLATLKLEDYALGQPGFDDGFSKWVEYNTDDLGSFKGGSAGKHLIFKRADGRWRFDKKYASVEDAWLDVRAGFERLIELGAEGRWDEIDDIEALYGGKSLRGKVAFLYYPDQLLPIYAGKHLDYWMKVLRVEADGDGVVGKNRRLFEAITEMPEFASWQPLEIMYFLYDWAHPNLDRTVLKIAPGEQANLWQDCLDHGYMRVGWDQLGDLTLFEDLAALRAGMAKHFPETNKSQVTRNSRGLLEFRTLGEGDVIVANRGTKVAIGLGRVKSGYRFREDLPSHRHTVEVDWFDVNEREVGFGSAWMPTIVKLKPEQYHAVVQGSTELPPVDEPLPIVPDVHHVAEKLLARNGQIIIFGPPGTGKTYSARRHAAWLLGGGNDNPEAAHAFGTADRLAALEKTFATASIVDERPSWLLVASPSQWSWDQLLAEGSTSFRFGRIHRNYADVEPGDKVFGYEATPTKAIVAVAEIEHGLVTSAEGTKTIQVKAGEKVANGPTWGDLNAHTALSQSEPVTNNMQGTLFRLEPFEAQALQALMTCNAGNDVVKPTGVAQLTRVTFHPTYTYEDFIEGYKPTESGVGGLDLRMRDGLFKRVCRAAAVDPDNPYVIVIDEINRGNVPKIFGELITLIENDKRGLQVTLPQSGETFMVPKNLHLIATMNTADRSIHVLDAALRRRFGFVELLPDPSVLGGASVGTLPLDEFLRELNALIRQHVGREKQVGHAVLMNGDKPVESTEDFGLAFRYELLPLLQEYTYGDYGELASLLGSDIIDLDEQTARAEILDDDELLLRALATHLNITLS